MSDANNLVNTRASDIINQVMKDLDVITETETARLQERVFVNVFLPFFAGDTDLKYPVDIRIWVNVAGSPYRPVNVVDNDGKVLFKVPPVFDRTSINPVSDGFASMGHVLATFSQYNNIHPAQGLNYLNHELKERALVMRVPAHILNELETWNAIFQRYGRPPIMKLDKPDESKPAETDSSPMDFDPL